jgi:hypothetical protein
LLSRLREEARSLALVAHRAGWSVVRRRFDFDGSDRVAFYGDTFTATALIRRKYCALLEPEFDSLTRLSRQCVKRDVAFGRLGDLLATCPPGFLKPADGTAKVFSAKVYDEAGRAELRRDTDLDTPSLWSEPVDWTMEIRAVVHHARILSLRCYAVEGRRSPNPLACLPLEPEVASAASDFIADVLEHRSDLPPSFVVDVGRIEGRGWAVVEFNSLWASRFFGGVTADYLSALADVVLPYGEVPAEASRWDLRSRS